MTVRVPPRPPSLQISIGVIGCRFCRDSFAITGEEDENPICGVVGSQIVEGRFELIRKGVFQAERRRRLIRDRRRKVEIVRFGPIIRFETAPGANGTRVVAEFVWRRRACSKSVQRLTGCCRLLRNSLASVPFHHKRRTWNRSTNEHIRK